MRHRTLCTFVLCSAVVICVAVGTVVGVGIRRQAADEATTALVETPAEAVTPVGAVDPNVPGGAPAEAPAAEAEGNEAAVGDEDGAIADPGADAQGDDDAGEQAPPEGEERPPGFNPQVPDLAFEPIPLPNWNPNPNGNGGGNNGNGNGNNGGNGNGNPPAPPAEEPWPLFIGVAQGRIGPGPIWERDGHGRCGNSDHSALTWSWMVVYVSQRPAAGPWTISATARAGNTTVRASVEQERGQPHRFKISYSFPRGSVQVPTNIAVNATVTDANGNRATMEQWGGTPGIGHRLFPANYCP